MVNIWNDKGELLQRLEGHQAPVNALSTLPDGRVVSGSFDETIKVWDVDSGMELNTLEGHTSWVNTLEAISDDRIVSGADDNRICVWDINTTELIASYYLDNTVTRCIVSPEHNTLVAGDEAGFVHFLRIEKSLTET